MRTAKSKAAEEGITLRDWVVKAIEAYSRFEVESREKPKRERKSVDRAENAGNFKNSSFGVEEGVDGVGSDRRGLQPTVTVKHAESCRCFTCRPPK